MLPHPPSSSLNPYKYHLLTGTHVLVTATAFFSISRQPYNRSMKIDQIETVFKATTLAAVVAAIGLARGGNRSRSSERGQDWLDYCFLGFERGSWWGFLLGASSRRLRFCVWCRWAKTVVFKFQPVLMLYTIHLVSLNHLGISECYSFFWYKKSALHCFQPLLAFSCKWRDHDKVPTMKTQLHSLVMVENTGAKEESSMRFRLLLLVLIRTTRMRKKRGEYASINQIQSIRELRNNFLWWGD